MRVHVAFTPAEAESAPSASSWTCSGRPRRLPRLWPRATSACIRAPRSTRPARCASNWGRGCSAASGTRSDRRLRRRGLAAGVHRRAASPHGHLLDDERDARDPPGRRAVRGGAPREPPEPRRRRCSRPRARAGRGAPVRRVPGHLRARRRVLRRQDRPAPRRRGDRLLEGRGRDRARWPDAHEGLLARTYGPPGLEEDVAFCAQVSVLDVVPRLGRMVQGAAEITSE